jgi:hypothetical protein
MFLGLPDPDPLVRGMDPDPDRNTGYITIVQVPYSSSRRGPGEGNS